MIVDTDQKKSTIVDSLVEELRSNIDVLLQRFDRVQCVELASWLSNSSGVVFFTGVGKSGIIAQKIAMTFSCTGTKSFFLSPQDALHGDIGAVGPNDTVFLLSKSGETAELLELCPALRNKGAHMVAVVMNPASRLVKACERSFVLPDVKELCPFDLSPTTSTVAQLIFGDLLAMTLMRIKGISLDSFIENHPGGRIGRRRLVKVRDLMISGDALPLCGPTDQLGDVLVELSNKQCGCICVVDECSNLLGIFTDGDLRRTLLRLGPAALGARMDGLMTKNPQTIGAEVLAYDAFVRMESNQQRPVTVLVVVDGSRCLGLIKLHDILQSGI